MSTDRTLIVGIGSPHGDDQIGWRVADRFASSTEQDHIDVRRAKSPVDLLDWLEDVRRLVICDSCRGLGRVGAMRRWKWPAPEISEIALSGTHTLSLPAVLALAKTLGRLPDDVLIWAIEGATSNAGQMASARAMQAVPEVVKQIVFELTDVGLFEAKACTNSP